MQTCDLHDVWHDNYPDSSTYTWHRPNSTQASRLDMFWLSVFFLPSILVVDILPFLCSEHSYVYLKMTLPDQVWHGPGIWKFNTEHLKDLSFILMITNNCESWRNKKWLFYHLSAWWDAGKVCLQTLIRSFSG